MKQINPDKFIYWMEWLIDNTKTQLEAEIDSTERNIYNACSYSTQLASYKLILSVFKKSLEDVK